MTVQTIASMKAQFKWKMGNARSLKVKSRTQKHQIQQNADNAAKTTIVTNPMVTGNDNNKIDFFAETLNNGSNSFLSELIINENQSFLLDQVRIDGTAADTM